MILSSIFPAFVDDYNRSAIVQVLFQKSARPGNTREQH